MQTPEERLELFTQGVVNLFNQRYITIASITTIYYDSFLVFSEEVDLIASKGWKSSIKPIYIFNKMIAIGFNTVTMYRESAGDRRVLVLTFYRARTPAPTSYIESALFLLCIRHTLTSSSGSTQPKTQDIVL